MQEAIGATAGHGATERPIPRYAYQALTMRTPADHQLVARGRGASAQPFDELLALGGMIQLKPRGGVLVGSGHTTVKYDVDYPDLTPSVRASDSTLFQYFRSGFWVGVASLHDEPFSASVWRFCDERGIRKYLNKAVELARASFPNVERLDADLRQDPDTGDEWIAFRVTARGSAQEILAYRRAFSAKWTSSVPWPERHYIRLSIDVA